MSNETQLTQLATDTAKEKSKQLNQSYKELKDAFEAKKNVNVEILDKTKGGLKVSYKGIPLYLSALHTYKLDVPDEELSKIIGKTIPVKVKEYEEEEFGKIVKINHKEVIEEKLWEEIAVNTKVEAKINAIIQGKGVTITLPNGLEGFIPYKHISREPIDDISSFVAVGDTVTGDIIEANRTTNRIIVSLRNAPSKHLNEFFDTHNIGDKIKGKLKTITQSRAYFTVAPNIDGFVRKREVTWTRKNIIFNDFFEGDNEYDLEIIRLDRDSQHIELSYRKTQPDNWQEIADKYEEGYTYSAVVEFIPPNGSGAEVSVNNEIDGFMSRRMANALYQGNKPMFKAKDVIQVKLSAKEPKTRSFFFESALKESNPYEDMGKSISIAGDKNQSKPEVIKNFTLGDLLSDKSKKALK